MKKILSAVFLAGAVALVGAPAAQATHEPGHTYPAAETATVSDAVVVAGQSFVFSGTGMIPGETVTILSGDDVIATTTADANGNFAVTLTLTEPGTHTLTATGAQSGAQVSAVVTVGSAAIETAAIGTAASGNNLADTGVDSRLMIWGAAGAGALALGAGAVVVARRRNS